MFSSIQLWICKTFPSSMFLYGSEMRVPSSMFTALNYQREMCAVLYLVQACIIIILIENLQPSLMSSFEVCFCNHSTPLSFKSDCHKRRSIFSATNGKSIKPLASIKYLELIHMFELISQPRFSSGLNLDLRQGHNCTTYQLKKLWLYEHCVDCSFSNMCPVLIPCSYQFAAYPMHPFQMGVIPWCAQIAGYEHNMDVTRCASSLTLGFVFQSFLTCKKLQQLLHTMQRNLKQILTGSIKISTYFTCTIHLLFTPIQCYLLFQRTTIVVKMHRGHTFLFSREKLYC